MIQFVVRWSLSPLLVSLKLARWLCPKRITPLRVAAIVNVGVDVSLILLAVRLLAPPPEASDPADMHAFYRDWLQPPWTLIFAPALIALLVASTAGLRWLRRVRTQLAFRMVGLGLAIEIYDLCGQLLGVNLRTGEGMEPENFGTRRVRLARRLWRHRRACEIKARRLWRQAQRLGLL